MSSLPTSPKEKSIDPCSTNVLQGFHSFHPLVLGEDGYIKKKKEKKDKGKVERDWLDGYFKFPGYWCCACGFHVFFLLLSYALCLHADGRRERAYRPIYDMTQIGRTPKSFVKNEGKDKKEKPD